jgi:hypothetical protein
MRLGKQENRKAGIYMQFFFLLSFFPAFLIEFGDMP